MSSSSVTFYLLLLQNGRFYAGRTQDPMKTLQTHREGLGPAWTQIHPPQHFVEMRPNMDPATLDVYVASMMEKYGVENVRGGSWSHVRLTDQDRMAVREAAGGQSGCVIC